MLLGGPLAEGKPAPSWPLEPRTDDERRLARLVGETDELTYMEVVRDAEEIVASTEFDRMHMLTRWKTDLHRIWRGRASEMPEFCLIRPTREELLQALHEKSPVHEGPDA